MYRTITARFAGKCTRCREAIPVGSSIRYGGPGRTYHLKANCPGTADDREYAAERAAEYRMTAEYQMETQGFVSSP